MDKWRMIDRPGYLGKHRDEKYADWDQKHGKGNWALWWSWGKHWIDSTGACLIYEMAYYHFLLMNRKILHQLVKEASNVYDDSETNVKSVFNYHVQETNRTHIQDIAIRNALLKLGVWFRGKELIQIRSNEGKHPLSVTLSPGRVPFHRPDLIVQPAITDWWLPGSVEDFYQSNKHLRVKKSPSLPAASGQPPPPPADSVPTLPLEDISNGSDPWLDIGSST